MKSLIFVSLFVSACSVEEMNVGKPDKDDGRDDNETEAPAEVPAEVPAEGSETEPTVPVVVDTITQEPAVGNDEDVDDGDGDGTKVKPFKTYKLVGENPANKNFVGGNYCPGNNFRSCYLRSGYIEEAIDGSMIVYLEVMDTFNTENPYTVMSAQLNDPEAALLLTNEALTAEDAGPEFKMLWAVVVKKDKTMAIVYDRENDGPTVQGDDMLDALEFVEVVK